MANDEFFRIILKNVKTDQEDELSSFCFEHRALGVSEQLAFRQNPKDYSVETLPQESHSIEAYFNWAPEPEFLEALKSKWPTVECEIVRDPVRDWLEEWKKGFEAFVLVPGVWVVPHWRPRPDHAERVIWMEPGMAFGTGTHETTQLASQMISEFIKPGSKVLDVGTGTGILALLARHLGAGDVVATEIEPDGRRVARENLVINGASHIEVVEEQIQNLVEPFDMVIANIIDGVLIQLQGHLKRLVKPGGVLILSGIIDERAEEFKSLFNPEPLHWAKETKKNEWFAYALERP